MNRARAALVAGFVLAAGAVSAWLWTRADSFDLSAPVRAIAQPATEIDLGSGEGVRDRTIELDAMGREGGFAATQNSPPPPAARALFNHELPLADRIDELDARARRGDAAAGCQLGFELLQCRRANEMREYFDNIEAQVSRHGTLGGTTAEIDARIEAAMEKRERHRALLAACEGVDARRWAEPARYLHAAAQAGHRAAMGESLSQSLYGSDALFRDPGLIGQLRATAPRYLEQLLAAGDSRLIDRIAVADLQTGDMLLGLMPPPWNRADLARAMMRHRADRLRPEGAPVPHDSDPPALREEARQLYEEYFAASEARDAAERQARGAQRHGDLSTLDCASLEAAQSSRR